MQSSKPVCVYNVVVKAGSKPAGNAASHFKAILHGKPLVQSILQLFRLFIFLEMHARSKRTHVCYSSNVSLLISKTHGCLWSWTRITASALLYVDDALFLCQISTFRRCSCAETLCRRTALSVDTNE